MKEFDLTEYKKREERDEIIRQMVGYIYTVISKRGYDEQKATIEENQLPPDFL